MFFVSPPRASAVIVTLCRELQKWSLLFWWPAVGTFIWICWLPAVAARVAQQMFDRSDQEPLLPGTCSISAIVFCE